MAVGREKILVVAWEYWQHLAYAMIIHAGYVYVNCSRFKGRQSRGRQRDPVTGRGSQTEGLESPQSRAVDRSGKGLSPINLLDDYYCDRDRASGMFNWFRFQSSCCTKKNASRPQANASRKLSCFTASLIDLSCWTRNPGLEMLSRAVRVSMLRAPARPSVLQSV